MSPCPGVRPSTSMGQLRPAPAILLVQVYLFLCTWIRPGKGVWIWHASLLNQPSSWAWSTSLPLHLPIPPVPPCPGRVPVLGILVSLGFLASAGVHRKLAFLPLGQLIVLCKELYSCFAAACASRLCLLPVLPRYYCDIRYYGILIWIREKILLWIANWYPKDLSWDQCCLSCS